MSDAIRDGFLKAHDLYKKYTGRKLSGDEWAELIEEAGKIGHEGIKHGAHIGAKIVVAVVETIEDENKEYRRAEE